MRWRIWRGNLKFGCLTFEVVLGEAFGGATGESSKLAGERARRGVASRAAANEATRLSTEGHPDTNALGH